MATSPKAVLNEMPVEIEPPFPFFTPRPLKENLNKQTANLLVVNTTPFKLIFKIIPNNKDINYIVRPVVGYVTPHGCRFTAVSMSENPSPKKEHDFTYKVVILQTNESFGISAEEFWDKNQLDTDTRRVQEAQFICVEPEHGATHESYRRVIPSIYDITSEKSPSVDYLKRLRRNTNLLDGRAVLSTPAVDSPSYSRRKSRSGRTARTDSDRCFCVCCDPNNYFWQSAKGMRSFFYGFLLSFVLSGFLFLRCKR
ncbi:unnamed protein product [Thelazia callipaeda]|uniref:Major sperm protein n=1 Tax=Thelazia callipaeda TaxID=103827 RepID=A0A0N5CUY7_THECL|nr:unnamed protein product [Thelazia callipaeda]